MKILFGGHEFILHPTGALLWPAQQMLIVADLHLEKGSHYAQRGYFLPPYDSHETLRWLLDLCETVDCKKLLVLGDGFHDTKGFQRLGQKEKNLFMQLQNYGLIWIKGNHDRDFMPFDSPALDAYTEGGILFRHEASKDEGYEISGHFHPKIDLTHKGGFISCRCFIEDGRKMIIPAFGAYTGGLAISNPAIREHFSGISRYYAINSGKIYFLPNAGYFTVSNH